MHSEYPIVDISLIAQNIALPNGGDTDQQFSDSDIFSLERIWASMGGARFGAGFQSEVAPATGVPSGLSGGHPGTFYTDVQVDGDEDVSLQSLRKVVSITSAQPATKGPEGLEEKRGSDIKPGPVLPSVSHRILMGLVQNNLRLKKRLDEMESIKEKGMVSNSRL